MVISAYRSAFDQAAAALMIYYILRRVNEDFQQNHITSYINKVCRHDHYGCAGMNSIAGIWQKFIFNILD